MDTASDIRIKVAEKAANDLVKGIETLKMTRKWDRSSALSHARSVLNIILEMKYSYLDKDAIVQTYDTRLKSSLHAILNALGGTGWHQYVSGVNVDKIRFCLNNLFNLCARIKLPDDPAYGVDIRVGQVLSCVKHPKADNLQICKVDITRAITVVTNDLNVCEGDRVAVALLPPVEFMGHISEGMFIGDESGVLRNVSGEIGTFPVIDSSALAEVRKHVIAYISS